MDKCQNLTELLYQQGLEPYGLEAYERATCVSLEEEDSAPFGVDLSGKASGKSFTIAAILGLANSDKDAMDLSVQERIQRGQTQLGYLYPGREAQRLGDGFGRLGAHLRQESHRAEARPAAQLKASRHHAVSCSGSGRSKRIRTIFTPEQLERLEAEFERQQYMVGPERLYLAHALQLTEAQVKVWFQNRRIKWRKHHLEVTQQRLAVLQRHRPDGEEL